MDFLTTARMLMDLAERHPDMSYHFVKYGGTARVVIEIPVDDDVAKMFSQARKLFEPLD